MVVKGLVRLAAALDISYQAAHRWTVRGVFKPEPNSEPNCLYFDVEQCRAAYAEVMAEYNKRYKHMQ
jgi:hypothetical protein